MTQLGALFAFSRSTRFILCIRFGCACPHRTLLGTAIFPKKNGQLLDGLVVKVIFALQSLARLRPGARARRAAVRVHVLQGRAGVGRLRAVFRGSAGADVLAEEEAEAGGRGAAET